MAEFLSNERPIVIDRVLAEIIGIKKAVVLQQVWYWVGENRRNGRNYRDGKFWTYNSIRAWHENCFSFYSLDTVKRTFSELRKEGLLIVANYNKDPRDKTNWYTVNTEKLAIMHEEYERQCVNKSIENLKEEAEKEAKRIKALQEAQEKKLEQMQSMRVDPTNSFAFDKPMNDADYYAAYNNSWPEETDAYMQGDIFTGALEQNALMQEGNESPAHGGGELPMHGGSLPQPLPIKYHTSTKQVQQTLCSRVQDAHCEPDVHDNHSDQPTALPSSPSALNHPDPEQVDGIGASKNKSVEKGEEHEHETEVVARKQEARENFERLWQLYPLKRGKGRVSDAKKQALLKYGYDQLVRAINRYTREVAEAPFEKCYQNGSTFFNSGFIDYLDENYEACAPKPKRGLSERTGKTLSNVYFEDHTPEDYDILEE